MKISVGEDREIVLEEVFSGVLLKTTDGEEFGICMRDSGFEFIYDDEWWEAKNGSIRKMGIKFPNSGEVGNDSKD